MRKKEHFLNTFHQVLAIMGGKKLIRIKNSVLDKQSMSVPLSRIECYQNYVDLQSGQEHYRLLRYLGTKMKGNFIEIGTHCGASALCIAYKKNVKLITYDLVNRKKSNYDDIKNIHFRITNFLTDSKYHKRILNSKLIFIDASHKGKLELEIYEWLRKNKYKGITIWDDIKLESMQQFWNSPSIKYDKIDLSKYGHITGTGCILFSDKIKFVLE